MTRDPEPSRWNQQYLDDLLAFLETAPMAKAVAEYNRITHDECAEGDDWLIAELGRCDLFFLLVRLLRRPDLQHDWLYARCREVEQSPDGFLDLWAREHYKSTIITFGLTIQDVLRNPDETVGIFSHTRPIAKAFLRQIKLEFEQNEDLKYLYRDILWADPRKESPKWSEDEGIVVRRPGNAKEATVEAWGLVDGMPTSKHFSRLIYDDVVTEASVNTPDMIEKTTRALELSYSLGAEGGVERFVGTRYHFNDSYRTVIERKTAVSRIYPATENAEATGNPVLMSKERLAKKRRDMGIYTFGCQMLQNPRADSAHGFQRPWLQHWQPNEGAKLNKYLLIDAANSKKANPDYTAMFVVGLGADENFYILDMVRDRLNLTERTERLFTLHRKWRPLEVRYEEYGMQSDIQHIRAEMDRETYRFQIITVAGKVRKEERIKRLVPMFEQHRVILPHSLHVTDFEGETRDLVHDFIEDEYMPFPVPVHDDMLDCLARILEPVAVGGEKLILKWPIKKAIAKAGPDWKPLDPGMGM